MQWKPENFYGGNVIFLSLFFFLFFFHFFLGFLGLLFFCLEFFCFFFFILILLFRPFHWKEFCNLSVEEIKSVNSTSEAILTGTIPNDLASHTHLWRHLVQLVCLA